MIVVSVRVMTPTCAQEVAGIQGASLPHDTKRFSKKINYKFTLNHAIAYALC
jgi:hypothetical protein